MLGEFAAVHGLIFHELRGYVVARHGEGVWDAMAREAGGSQFYLATRSYPDEEMAGLLQAASRRTAQPVAAILEDFGEFVAPRLAQSYRILIQPGWKTLDLLEHTEQAIHTLVRLETPGADPPHLTCRRLSPTEVLVIYHSLRRLCAVAKGIARGLATYFKERVDVRDARCMHQGAPSCSIHVCLATA